MRAVTEELNSVRLGYAQYFLREELGVMPDALLHIHAPSLKRAADAVAASLSVGPFADDPGDAWRCLTLGTWFHLARAVLAGVSRGVTRTRDIHRLGRFDLHPCLDYFSFHPSLQAPRTDIEALGMIASQLARALGSDPSQGQAQPDVMYQKLLSRALGAQEKLAMAEAEKARPAIAKWARAQLLVDAHASLKRDMENDAKLKAELESNVRAELHAEVAERVNREADTLYEAKKQVVEAETANRLTAWRKECDRRLKGDELTDRLGKMGELINSETWQNDSLRKYLSKLSSEYKLETNATKGKGQQLHDEKEEERELSSSARTLSRVMNPSTANNSNQWHKALLVAGHVPGHVTAKLDIPGARRLPRIGADNFGSLEGNPKTAPPVPARPTQAQQQRQWAHPPPAPPLGPPPAPLTSPASGARAQAPAPVAPNPAPANPGAPSPADDNGFIAVQKCGWNRVAVGAIVMARAMNQHQQVADFTKKAAAAQGRTPSGNRKANTSTRTEVTIAHNGGFKDQVAEGALWARPPQSIVLDIRSLLERQVQNPVKLLGGRWSTNVARTGNFVLMLAGDISDNVIASFAPWLCAPFPGATLQPTDGWTWAQLRGVTTRDANSSIWDGDQILTELRRNPPFENAFTAAKPRWQGAPECIASDTSTVLIAYVDRTGEISNQADKEGIFMFGSAVKFVCAGDHPTLIQCGRCHLLGHNKSSPVWGHTIAAHMTSTASASTQLRGSATADQNVSYAASGTTMPTHGNAPRGVILPHRDLLTQSPPRPAGSKGPAPLTLPRPPLETETPAGGLQQKQSRHRLRLR
ncbi:hypothetical protein EDB86DRAFT_2835430 [Lactarius hatsudake]|nr:hypothetical protein EDB86DRAFT_2835430 [Lactarius hatsudake]